jgi:hypothetical protein
MENPDIQSQIAEIESLRRQAKIWRTSLVLILVALIAISVVMPINAAKGLMNPGPKHDQFIQQLGTTVQTDIMPRLQEVGNGASKQLTEVIKKRTPDMANASIKELRLLSQDIPLKGKEILSTQFNTALEGRAAKLKATFPDTDEEQIKQLLVNLGDQTQKQLASITDELFTPHIETMNDIVVDIDAIRSKEKATIGDDMPTWEMAFLIIDIAQADFKEQTIPQTTNIKPAKAGKGKK